MSIGYEATKALCESIERGNNGRETKDMLLKLTRFIGPAVDTLVPDGRHTVSIEKEHIAILICNNHTMAVGFDKWPEPIEVAKDESSANLWKATHDLIEQIVPYGALGVVAARLNQPDVNGTKFAMQNLIKECEDARSKKSVPCVVVLAGIDGQRAAGLVCVIPLPPTESTQKETLQ